MNELLVSQNLNIWSLIAIVVIKAAKFALSLRKVILISFHLSRQFHLSDLDKQLDQVAKVFFFIFGALRHIELSFLINDIRRAWPAASVCTDAFPHLFEFALQLCYPVFLRLLQIG